MAPIYKKKIKKKKKNLKGYSTSYLIVIMYCALTQNYQHLEGVRLFLFPAKMRGKDELKDMWSILTKWLCVYEHRGESVNLMDGSIFPKTRNYKAK